MVGKDSLSLLFSSLTKWSSLETFLRNPEGMGILSLVLITKIINGTPPIPRSWSGIDFNYSKDFNYLNFNYLKLILHGLTLSLFFWVFLVFFNNLSVNSRYNYQNYLKRINAIKIINQNNI